MAKFIRFIKGKRIFGVNSDDIVTHKKEKKQKKMTIIKAVGIAVGRLPKTFQAYKNPYSRSLVSEVRIISHRPFVSSVTIMRRLRESHLVKCIDSHKSIYRKL